MLRESRRETPRLACRRTGHGPRLVLLHCSAGSGSQWRALRGQLEGSFQVMAPDLLGYGASPLRRDCVAPSLTEHALLVAREIDPGPGPVHLVGHSFGGAVALRLALLLGSRVRSLTLIEPVVFQLLRTGRTGDGAAYSEISRLAGTMGADLSFGRPARAMRRFVDFWNGAGAWASMPTQRRSALAAQAPQVVQDFDAINAEPTRLDALARLSAPTLVVHGGRSPLPALLASRRVAAAVADARQAQIRDAGHMAPITHSKMVNLLLATHLDTAEQRARTRRSRRRPARTATAPFPGAAIPAWPATPIESNSATAAV